MKIAPLILSLILLVLSPFKCQAATQTIEKVYVFPATHADVGFDAPPSVIESQQTEFLENAVTIAYARPEFFWMIETTRLLESYERAGKPMDALVNLLKNGRMNVGAAYTNPHTALLGQEEMFRLLYPVKRLENKYGFKSEVAILNDIPGFSWAIPTVLAKSGIKYVVAGSNTSLGGKISIPKKDNPFYWQGPDGSKVLVWLTPDNYLEGYFTWKINDYNAMQQSVPNITKDYERAGYNKDSALMIFGTGDHGRPEPFISVMNNINKWNNAGKSPEFIIADPTDFFKHMEENYGDAIPAYSGDFSGLWDVNKRFSPAANALRNKTRDHITVAELFSSLNSIFTNAKYPDAEIYEIYRNMLFNSDHGAGAGTTWPGLLTVGEVNQSNLENFNFVKDAHDSTERLLESSLKSFTKLFEAEKDTIIVINPLPAIRTDLVSVKISDRRILPDKDKIRVVTIKDIASEELTEGVLSADGDLEFTATDIPKTGYKKYKILEYGKEVKANTLNDSILENEFYRVEIDEANGSIISIFDKELNKEIVKTGSNQMPFNGLYGVPHNTYFGFHGTPSEPKYLLKNKNVDVSYKATDISQTASIKTTGTPLVSTTVTLYSGIKRVYIQNVLDISKIPVIPNEDHSINYLFAFPFNMDKSNMEIKYDTPGGLISPETDYMPGAYNGNLITQHSIMIRDKSNNGFTAILSNRESYINLWNGAVMLSNKYAPLDASILSLAMAKQDYGETKDKGLYRFERLEPVESDLRVFNYAIKTEGPAEDIVTRAKSEGWSFNVPLIASYTPKAAKGIINKDKGSFIDVSESNVMPIVFKKAESWSKKPNSESEYEYYVLRLKEYEGKKTNVKIDTIFGIKNAWLANAVEEPISQLSLSDDKSIDISVDPRDTVTILLEVKSNNITNRFSKSIIFKAIKIIAPLLGLTAITAFAVFAYKTLKNNNKKK